MRIINSIRNIMKKVRPVVIRFFSRNIGRKIMSILIAMIIWIMAVNISNPEVTVETNVNIAVNYSDALESADMTYTLETTTARVSYTVRSDNRSRVHPGDFSAYINLIDYSITGAVPVYVDVDPSVSEYVSDITVSPIVVRVDTEEMVEKSFDIIENIEGSPASGKAVGNLDLSTQQVTLYGPSSDVGRIASCGVIIAVNSSDSDITGIADPIFYDSNGNEVELDSRTQIRETISYTLYIYNTKRYAILAGSTGTPASGYSVSSVSCDPASVLVYGPDSILNLYNNISIPDSVVNVSGARGNVAVLIDASQYLPEGLELVDTGDVSIVANVVRSSTLPGTPESDTSAFSSTQESSSANGGSDESSSQSEGATSSLNSGSETSSSPETSLEEITLPERTENNETQSEGHSQSTLEHIVEDHSSSP